MIGARREGGLITEPSERADQGEQVDPIDIGSRRSLGLGTLKPGPISTPSSDAFRESFPGISGDEWLQYVPLGRVGVTDDIAEVVALLASDRGSFLTGVNYRVDGGMTAC